MPAQLRRLVVAVTAGGALSVILASLLTDERPAWWRLALVLGVFLAGETALFHIRLGHDHRTFTWAETACVLSLAAAPGTWVVLCGTAAVACAHLLRRRALIKVAFNASSVAIGLMTARTVRREFVGTFEETDLTQPASWLGLAAAAAAYFLVTTALVSLAVAWSQSRTFWSVHRKDLPLNALVAVGNIGMGLLVVSEAAMAPVLLLPLPLIIAILIFFYKTSLRAAQERDTWESLQSASGALLQLKGDALHDALLEWSARLFEAEGVDLLTVANGKGSLSTWRSDGTRETRTGDPFALAGTFWGRALSDREPFEIHVGSAPATQREELAASGLTSCIVAPLLVQNECIGTLRLGFRGRISLGRRERQVFATFANHVSSALHNDRLFSEVRTMALHDPLTGLPNRTLLIDRLDEALHRSRRDGRDLAVLFLDLDQFKVVNDSLGHDVGDRLLVAISQRLTAALRPGDTATRFGGDEFVVICERVANENEATVIAARLAEVLSGALILDGSDVYVTASIGVAVASAANADRDAIGLIRDADAAMYKAKAAGRARTHVFDSATRAGAVARLEIESQLRNAAERGELRLVYQPTLDATSQRVVGAEALVRWEHPTKGMVPPIEFIQVAEETGIISTIGAWVLDEACRQVAEWRARPGFLDADFRVGINLSPHQINNPALVEEVLATLQRHGVPVTAICLEITESALLLDTDIVAQNIRRLDEAGIELALDDFGTGYSSVSYLHRLPVKVLKIDRSFIGRVGAGAREDAIVTGIVDLAHTLGMRVVAEGVETASQLAGVQEMGCDRVQGFYFAKPSDAAQFEELVATVAAF